jgi:hypothetical protein
VEKVQWIKMATNSRANTGEAAELRNLIRPRTNLEMRANFFSVLVIDK